MAPSKKNARRKKAHLVFIDESGFSLTPTLMRTWAPRGRTPVLTHVHDRRTLSAIAAITVSPVRGRFGRLLHVWPEALDTRHVIAFLRALMRHLRGPITVVWDRLGAHRSSALWDFLLAHPRLNVAWLPAYAPELNPVEWLWAHLKTRSLAHLCPADADVLSEALGDAANRLDQRLLRGFIQGSGLPLALP